MRVEKFCIALNSNKISNQKKGKVTKVKFAEINNLSNLFINRLSLTIRDFRSSNIS